MWRVSSLLLALGVIAGWGIGCSGEQPSVDSGVGVSSQAAIVDGWKDPGLFPEVCTITWEDPNDVAAPRFSLCSGVLLSPKVMLTAGHCAFIEAWGIYSTPKISCDPVFRPGRSVEHTGHFQIIPTMDPDNGIWDPDVSVFLLDKPIRSPWYAKLPPVGLDAHLLDGLAEGQGPLIVTVGFGIADDSSEDTGTRRVTGARFNSIDEYFVWADPAPGHLGAGDSGGPAYLSISRVLLGINIMGGLPFGFGRMDRPDVQDFIEQFLQRR